MLRMRLLQSVFSVWLLFSIGLIVRLALIICADPAPMNQWFAPFVQFFCTSPSVDPWTHFLAAGGAVKSFPYGIIMVAAILPLAGVGHALGHSVLAIGFGIRLTLLTVDFGCLLLLNHLLPKSKNFLLWFWWLSPLVLAACYWVGQLDVIPVFLLLWSFICLMEKRYASSGLLLALALSAKLSMALVVPFILLYFLRNARMRPYFGRFLKGFVPAGALLLGLPLCSSGYQVMTLGTSELLRLLDLHLSMGEVNLYITPLFFVLVTYGAWRVTLLCFDLMTAFSTIGILTVVLTTTTPPGWYLWAWPLLLLHLVKTRSSHRLLGYGFSLLAAATQITFWPAPQCLGATLAFHPIPQSQAYSLVLTALFSMGTVLMIGILRSRIQANDMYRFGQKPISIAITGDSGAGKDTLAESLIQLLGTGDTTHISGDDYHLWDRKGGGWKVITHLNPRANDLKQLFVDVNAVLDGQAVVRRHYQHSGGHFSHKFAEPSRRFCIISGLHTLLSEAASRRFDVRVFLEMEEPLRLYFKCRRDTCVRGHTYEAVAASLEQRRPDSLSFIAPQAKQADIHFIRRLVHNERIDPSCDKVPLTTLEIRLKHSLYHEQLARQLIALCGLRVDVSFMQDMSEVILSVDGDVFAEDLAMIAEQAMPELEELLAILPQWENGWYGLMQLVVLYQLVQNLKAVR